ncbi:MAG: LysM peptidoglycan-binding domain-containing protein [Bacteroidetes bacterium]|nr:LysM peptidoglycan-binding domain-containing protein [Bacteroidota bacterium]
MRKSSFTLSILALAVTGLIISASCKQKKDPYLDEAKQTEKAPVKKEVPVKDTTEKVVPPPPPKEEAPKQEPRMQVYVVQEGDWLWQISREKYGSALGWSAIYDLNKDKINNPDLIFPGQELLIPEWEK